MHAKYFQFWYCQISFITTWSKTLELLQFSKPLVEAIRGIRVEFWFGYFDHTFRFDVVIFENDFLFKLIGGGANGIPLL